MYSKDFNIITGKSPVAISISYDEAPMKGKQHISMDVFSKLPINLNALPSDKLYGMTIAFCDLSEYECLFVWLHYFLLVPMRKIESEYGLSISKQRTIYKKFNRKAKIYAKRYREKI